MSREMFQIGDTVRVKTWEELKNTANARFVRDDLIVLDGVNFVDKMKSYCGHEFVIKKCLNSGSWLGYTLRNLDMTDIEDFLFNDEMLLPVNPVEFDESEFLKLLEGK